MDKPTLYRDSENKKIIIERVVSAPRDRVWDAWTDEKQLEKWWGPKEWPATSQSMDFREGGHWHYYMTGPDGSKAWGWLDYETIEPKERFTALDSFCNNSGVKDTDLPSTHWLAEFHDQGDSTKIVIVMTFENLDDMEKLIQMGFEEGFGQALSNLDELLA